jgi:hypothetical protein
VDNALDPQRMSAEERLRAEGLQTLLEQLRTPDAKPHAA